jgi:hypothetical protein
MEAALADLGIEEAAKPADEAAEVAEAPAPADAGATAEGGGSSKNKKKKSKKKKSAADKVCY